MVFEGSYDNEDRVMVGVIANEYSALPKLHFNYIKLFLKV